MVQLVLLERVPNLGIIGDIVNVKPGYARNFLIPTNKALRASPENIKRFESERAELEAKNLETKAEAEKVKLKIHGQSVVIIRSASDSGSLYGSVTGRNVVTSLNKEDFILDRKQIILAKPIKELGLHKVLINLHPEVIAEIEINVARSSEEAAIQKSGKTIQDVKVEADAEADIDMAELFDDVGAAAALIEDNEHENAEANASGDSETNEEKEA